MQLKVFPPFRLILVLAPEFRHSPIKEVEGTHALQRSPSLGGGACPLASGFARAPARPASPAGHVAHAARGAPEGGSRARLGFEVNEAAPVGQFSSGSRWWGVQLGKLPPLASEPSVTLFASGFKCAIRTSPDLSWSEARLCCGPAPGKARRPAGRGVSAGLRGRLPAWVTGPQRPVWLSELGKVLIPACGGSKSRNLFWGSWHISRLLWIR